MGALKRKQSDAKEPVHKKDGHDKKNITTKPAAATVYCPCCPTTCDIECSNWSATSSDALGRTVPAPNSICKSCDRFCELAHILPARLVRAKAKPKAKHNKQILDDHKEYGNNKDKVVADRNLKHEEVLVETAVGSVFLEPEHTFESKRTFKNRHGVQPEDAKLLTLTAKTLPNTVGAGIGILRKTAADFSSGAAASGGGGNCGDSVRGDLKDCDQGSVAPDDDDCDDDAGDDDDADDDAEDKCGSFQPLRAYRYTDVKVIRRKIVLEPGEVYFQNQYERAAAHEQGRIQTMWGHEHGNKYKPKKAQLGAYSDSQICKAVAEAKEKGSAKDYANKSTLRTLCTSNTATHGQTAPRRQRAGVLPGAAICDIQPDGGVDDTMSSTADAPCHAVVPYAAGVASAPARVPARTGRSATTHRDTVLAMPHGNPAALSTRRAYHASITLVRRHSRAGCLARNLTDGQDRIC